MIRFLFTIVFYIIFLCSVRAEELIFLVPHRAVYDFHLDNVSRKMTIVGISGRMVHEFMGSTCQGYTTRVSFINRIYTEDMPVRLISQEVKVYETDDGNKFHFNIKNTIGQNIANNTEGIAERTKDEILVKLKKPKENVYKLAKADFPITLLKNIIRQAKAGHNFYNSTLFNGENGADRVVKESFVIGEKRRTVPDSEMKELKKINKNGYWPIIVSHFDDTKNKEGLPIYRSSFNLYENGVMNDIFIDYGDFSIRSKLKSLQFFDTKNDLDNCKH
ncbi:MULTISPECIES: EipB family protein [unclassified Bartonella]|uniref:EipB family protein n=1 Tax=unclassified Bartonella TaxID=2645622 RepID=UPI00099937E3|nr:MULTISPECIES: DUF1849 family protein [unclassified Bartonella]AQX28136.1 hypothetical protein BJB15x_007380 [Bartonella sp. JB15]AQX29407.1 protein of unknown function (DUF1849) [Bartonella sp. JB63]